MTERLYAQLLSTGDVSPKSWHAFLTGERVAPPLLRRLLTLRYAGSRRIQISETIHELHSNEDELTLYETLRKQRSPPPLTFIIHLIVHRYAPSDVTTLAIVSQKDSQITVFTCLEHHDAMLKRNELPTGVRFVMNTSYAYYVDNGFFVFAFLDAFFHAKEAPLHLPVTNDPAHPIIKRILRADTVETHLITLYDEITHRAAGSASGIRQLEEAKQRLYRWALYGSHQEEEEEPDDKTLLTHGFFAMESPEGDDEIATNTKMTPNDVFSEMMMCIRFIQRVILPEHGARYYRLRVHGTPRPVDSVVRHIHHLLYRLVVYIDALNTPVLTPILEAQVGFTTLDYTRLREEHRLSYRLMLGYARANAWLDDTQCLLMNTQEAEQEGVAQRLRHINFVVLSAVGQVAIDENKLIEEEYVAFMTLTRDPSPCYSLYIPAIDRDVMSTMMDRADALVARYRLAPIYRIELVSQSDPELQDYYLAPWFALFIIRDVCRATALASPPDDWLDLIPPIVNRITSKHIEEIIRALIRYTQVTILSAFFMPIEPVVSCDTMEQEDSESHTLITIDDDDDDSGDDDDGYGTIGINSTLVDLAILAMPDEFLSDNILNDMVKLLGHDTNCYIFDALFWHQMVLAGDDKIQKYDVFENSAITTILMPINQDNEHWALATIKKHDSNVSYYSSIKDDPYFAQFQETAERFLAKQHTKKKTYRFYRRRGDIQPCDSMDCAIYVLNEIQRVCHASETKQVKWTRRSVLQYLFGVIRDTDTPIESKVRLLERQTCLFYFTPPSGWPDIELAAYKKQFTTVLATILALFEYFSDDSIVALVHQLASIQQCPTNLFFDTLRTKKTNGGGGKRPHIDDVSESEKNKARKCIKEMPSELSDDEANEVKTYLARLLFVQEITEWEGHTMTSKQYFKKTYGAEMREVFVRFIVMSARIVEMLIEFMYEKKPDIEQFFAYFLDLLEAYGRPPEIERIMLHCVICQTQTNQVNLFFNQAFCSIECFDQYCSK